MGACAMRTMLLLRTIITVLSGACATQPRPEPEAPEVRPEATGAALVLDLTPANRPSVRGDYGFDLLAEMSGMACATSSMRSSVRYWVGMPDIDKLAPDRLTQQAIAAAAHDAIS